jgi:hypothetical protein
LRRPNPAFLIIDESPVMHLIEAESFPLRLLGSKGYAKADKPLVRVVLHALLNDTDPAEAAEPEAFENLARKAWNSARGWHADQVMPDDPDAEKREKIVKRYRQLRQYGKRIRPALMQRFWLMLAAQAAGGHEHVWVFKPARPPGELLEAWQDRWQVNFGQRRAIMVPCPRVLLLDAGADPILTDKFLPGAEHVAVGCRSKLVLIRVTGAPRSKSDWLGRSVRQRWNGRRQGDAEAMADPRSNLKRLERAERLLTALGHDVCVAGFKAVRAALPEEHRKAFMTFGAIRGLDGYKHHTAMIVAGRMLPPPWSIMAMAKAFFFDDPVTVSVPESFIDDRGWLVYPTDPRFRALQRQLGEEEINQTIGRLRPVWRTEPALALVAADIAFTRHGPWAATLPWEAIVPSRLQLALLEAGGVLPLSAKLLHQRWPDLWTTENAAELDVREARKGAHEEGKAVDRLYRSLLAHPLFFYRRSTVFPDALGILSAGPPHLMTCRVAGQRGHSTTVLVAPWVTDARARLEAFFGIEPAFWQEGEEAEVSSPGEHAHDHEQPDRQAEAPISRLADTIVRGAGVLPLSSSELARLHPDLWPSAKVVDHWRARHGGRGAMEDGYWGAVSQANATRVGYRRPGQTRGSLHQALIPGDVHGPEAARLALEAVVGEMAAVEVVETLHRPADRPGPASLPRSSSRPLEQDEAEITVDPAPTPVVDHPRRWAVLSPPFAVPPAEPANGLPPPPLAPPRVVRLPACPLAAGNLAAAVEPPSPIVVPTPRPALPANANDPAPWTDDRWWSSGFLRCKTAEERLSRLRRWVEAAGGTLVAVDGMVQVELPLLEPCLGRAELLRFCRQLRVSAREAGR